MFREEFDKYVEELRSKLATVVEAIKPDGNDEPNVEATKALAEANDLLDLIESDTVIAENNSGWSRSGSGC